MKKNQIKLIILDAYGVVLSRGYPDTCAAIAKKYHLPYQRVYEVLYIKYFNLAAERKISQREAWARAVAELNIPTDWHAVAKLHFSLIKPNRPVFKLIPKLRRKYQVIVLSKNTRSQLQETKKRVPQMWRVVDEVVNTWEYRLPKASAQTIRFLSRRYHCQPTEMLFIDDQSVNIEAAAQAGARTIFYQNFDQFQKELQRYATV